MTAVGPRRPREPMTLGMWLFVGMVLFAPFFWGYVIYEWIVTHS